MNRRIAAALILTLLAQSLLPGLALALPLRPPVHSVLICTGDGFKRVTLDPGTAEPRAPDDRVPQVQHCCPCGLACGGCALVGPGQVGMRVAYGSTSAFRLQRERMTPASTRAPLAHRSRAPPVSS